MGRTARPVSVDGWDGLIPYLYGIVPPSRSLLYFQHGECLITIRPVRPIHPSRPPFGGWRRVDRQADPAMTIRKQIQMVDRAIAQFPTVSERGRWRVRLQPVKRATRLFDAFRALSAVESPIPFSEALQRRQRARGNPSC